ncbi:MAG TPA: MlaE family lipid ABC transporter permease subunit [Planctomycetota bacterium]|nr:MlaE family lipid ABC transporter permease subunit [Planctomycetota bacterium]
MTSRSDLVSWEVEPRGSELHVRLRGRVDADGLSRLWRELVPEVRRAGAPRLVVDAGEAELCGVSCMAVLAEIRDVQRKAGREAEIRGLSPRLSTLLDRFRTEESDRPEGPGRGGAVRLLGALGRRADAAFRNAREALAFVGEATRQLGRAVRDPRRLRGREILRTATRAGADALPIVILLGFLMGVILAFQSASSLQRFGAEGYVAELVGLSMAKELGPLMAAIVLAARSGSAFAAEIGTMKINEELDALTTMGVPPHRFLVLPRVAGAVLAVPFLSVFTIFAGLFGGLLIVNTFGMPLASYVERIARTVPLSAYLASLGKTFAFGLLVGGVACLRGLQTETGPMSVGASTTRSVVSGIVLIIVADAFFSFLFYRWGI